MVAVPQFVSSKTIPVHLLYWNSISILMPDISNKIAPSDILDLFLLSSDIHTRYTRSSFSGNFYVHC